jgi:hypothetical protein
MAGKWLELLTEIAPAVRRPALMFNPETAPYVELLSRIEVNRDARDIQSADPLEADLNSPPSTTTGSATTEPRRRRRR